MSALVAPVRAAVDTNVLVSGLLSPHGPPARIVDAFRRHRFELVVSPQVLDELLDVLLRPRLGISVREAASIVATVRNRAHLTRATRCSPPERAIGCSMSSTAPV